MNTARMSFLMFLTAGFLGACAGGRQKQAVAVQPAPGSTQQPAADANGGQQTQQGGDQQGDFPTEGEEANPGAGEQTDVVPGDDNGQETTTTPTTTGTPGSQTDTPNTNNNESVTNNGTTTDLTIEATLDNGVASAIVWDGKSFKGSGKWKVEPMP